MNEVIYTVGHSTHPIVEFIRMLDVFEIDQVIDVRTIPESRHNSQFNKEELREESRKHAIEYFRLEGLGGLRHTTKTSIFNEKTSKPHLLTPWAKVDGNKITYPGPTAE